MNAFFDFIGRYFANLANELGDIAQKLDANGWAVVCAILLVCGWFWLRGTKITAA
ncbi:MAG: hypothetical protein AAF939_18155 [Planctomycetota bacterium]